MYMACPFESELKPYLRSDFECDKKKKKQVRSDLSHPLHFLCAGYTCLYANASPVARSGEWAESRLPEWGSQRHSSGRGDEGGV